jgi:hypothetical protein
MLRAEYPLLHRYDKFMDSLSSRAIAAAIFISQELGLRNLHYPEILADGSNVLVHLKPAPIVARVATTTGLVRKPIENWLALDLDIAGHLAAKNFPVVAPSAELPAGPHLHDGLALTFWQFVDHDPGQIASAEETGPLLRQMHAALREYPGTLQRLSPFFEIPQWLDEMESLNALDGDDMAMLRRGHEILAAKIDALNLLEQPLHGDAHRKNLLRTSRGLLWTDFEDACSGPIEWDIACFIRTSGEDPKTALASYGNTTDMERLQPFFEARDLQGAIWGAILSTRFPDRHQRAREWMELCRRRYERT